MKIPLLLAAAVLLALAPVRGAEPESAPAIDFSAFKTADEFWKKVEELQKPPTEKPATRESAMALAKSFFETQRTAADAFAKAFPEDPRRWQAKMVSIRADSQLRRIGGTPGATDADKAALDAVINAPDAPANAKAEAAFMRATTLTADFDKTRPQTYAPFHAAAADFLAKYPDHPLAAQMQTLQMRVLASDASPEGAVLLKKLAASSDAKVAESAQSVLTKRERMADLKTKPLDLKFTSVSNEDVDLALMRGKVVLVDFWASWCGPCIAEMPNVVATYQKLHSKGFEIVGISLDQDKEKMQEALKKHGMTWMQHFDGLGWKNKISSGYGIDSIPATWLIDKKGMLRESGLRGEALESAVVRLLRE